jgi:polyferredoxin
VLTALAANGYLPGFVRGTIYQGGLKSVCVPFINCYSCPGALGACPVGSIQSLAAGGRFSFLVLGTTLAAGSLAGRAICGWLCPFGLIQEWLKRLSAFRLAIPPWLLKGKYVVLVLLLPLSAFWLGTGGLGAPYFCQYICPAGTLEAGIPLLLLNPSLRVLAGSLWRWKLVVLAMVVVASAVTFRPFCRVMCPLGAFYGLLNHRSAWRLHVDGRRCEGCGQCAAACPLDLDVSSRANDPECLRCLRCAGACPHGAVAHGFTAAGEAV